MRIVSIHQPAKLASLKGIVWVGVAATAKLLGFADHDIQILMNTGKLVPLGDPAPNAPKWFSAVAICRLAIDEDWLHKATRDLAKYWKHKRARGRTSETLSRTAKPLAA